MNFGDYEILGKKILIRIQSRVCETPEELLNSDIFRAVVRRGIEELKRRNSFLLGIFTDLNSIDREIPLLFRAFEFLAKMPGKLLSNVLPDAKIFMRDPALFNDFVEYLYNYWRSFDRFILCDSTGADLDQRPYRTFNGTIEQVTHLVRGVYRDIQENITSVCPRIYRQVRAGAEVSAISIPKSVDFPGPQYGKLNNISLIRHILLYPPLILNPSMNKRTGKFIRIEKNPLDLADIDPRDWLCYPAKVGTLLIHIYFHKTFIELGFSLCNLFKLADDQELEKRPDAVYLFGVPGNSLDGLAEFPTVFYEDTKNDILVAACPNRPEFGYFGYLKKMALTLHNIKMMRQGNLPFHGALVRILLKGGKGGTVLFIGDTGAGKSETLEALNELGKESIRDLVIIADDMGSLQMDDKGDVLGFGTEIGAFLRLDDLKPGYAFGQIDRAIIMSPTQINARIILPVTTYENVIKGQKIDMVLYANNYEDIDDEHPLLEKFERPEDALKVFREGAVMSKGTTTSTGIVHSYFANVFGPPQYKELHEPLTRKFFDAFFRKGIFVGQIRTRLGLSGWERKGAEEAAEKLLELIK
ncbi:MAG: phosphoenolpyruvate carboxykinase [Candidatus Omnitrophota bacterium]